MHEYNKATDIDLKKYATTIGAEIKATTYALHNDWKKMRKEMNAVFPKP
jgi:hypothetical protein